MPAQTLYDKLFDSHLVAERGDGAHLLYIDLHLVHEVTSPQAFEGLRQAGRPLWRPEAMVATMDHVTPTDADATQPSAVADTTARLQLKTLADNCDRNDLLQFPMGDARQGIVHVIGPEQGLTQPGMTIVCGDSHTSTHGALGALATGIGTSDVEHVMATGCLLTQRQKTMQVVLSGELAPGVYSKDIALALIGRIGTGGGTGYALEFTGEGIGQLSIEARMTLCNMAVEAGSRNGLVGVDDKTLEYVAGRPFAPRGKMLAQAERYWRDMVSDADASADACIELDLSDLAPQITWGTSPEMVVSADGRLPELTEARDGVQRQAMDDAYRYMGLEPGTPVEAIEVDQVFIGSCTNSRIEDLRSAADVVKGRQVSPRIKRAMVVPGSRPVQQQAEREGLADIFVEAGFQWRRPGCSMCIAMNPDRLKEAERCASTSNRNFEGRQGRGGRTHLLSPASAAAAAVTGRLADVRRLQSESAQ